MDYYYHKVATAVNLHEGRRKGVGGERLAERRREREKPKGYGEINADGEREIRATSGGKMFFVVVSTFESHNFAPT